MNYLHTAQFVRCWEQIGAELLTQTAILFRACHASDYKSRRELSITSVSRHHTLKRCYIYAYIHSCSSRAISCRQTRQSVVGRYVNAHAIQSDSQSIRRVRILCSLGPSRADPPTLEADLRLFSFTGRLQQQSRQQIDRQTDRRTDRLQMSQK